MDDALVGAYHWLPPALRSVAASLRGWYLDAWRYGPETESLIEQAREREFWSAARWQRWREERLAFVLHRAATRVPFYRRHWAERRRKGDASSWERLENWPLLDKEEVRQNPLAFLAGDCDPRRMYTEQTSGTTGKPLRLWWSLETVRAWYALFEARCRRWHGVTREDRWAMLGGQLVTPVARRKPPFWVWNAGMRQLYLSSYHLAPDLAGHYLEALERHRVRYLLGYSSSLNALAQEALRLGWRGMPLKVAITNAEPLYDFQRQAIQQAFRCPVRESYGMAEIVAAAGECERGGLHLWPEAGAIEVLEGDGNAGELICTSLLNADMPLIRYRVGDRSGPPQSAGCPCGRTLPLLPRGIEGRTNDLLITRDGRQVFWINPVFYGLPVREAQVVQESLDAVRVRYVAGSGFNAETAACIRTRLQERLGPFEIALEPVEQVPRTAAGKLRAVVSHVGD